MSGRSNAREVSRLFLVGAFAPAGGWLKDIADELSNRAKAALPEGADRIHIYDTPLQVLAGLLAIGFVLTLIVRPLRPAPVVSASAEMRTREAH